MSYFLIFYNTTVDYQKLGMSFPKLWEYLNKATPIANWEEVVQKEVDVQKKWK